jgi:hypothetical protein
MMATKLPPCRQVIRLFQKMNLHGTWKRSLRITPLAIREIRSQSLYLAGILRRSCFHLHSMQPVLNPNTFILAIWTTSL